MPISTASAPPSMTARTTSSHWLPSPPVTYGTSSLRPARAAARADALRGLIAVSPGSRSPEPLGDLRGVLVAPTRERDEHGRARRHRVAGFAREPADRVRRLERGHDAFGLREQLEAGERFVVGRGVVLGPARRPRASRARGRRRDSRGRR